MPLEFLFYVRVSVCPNGHVDKITCCCPPASSPRQVCLEKDRVLMKVWTEYFLVDNSTRPRQVGQPLSSSPQSSASPDGLHTPSPHCEERRRKVSQRINCGRRAPKIRVSQCSGEFRQVTVTNRVYKSCRCVQSLAKYKLRCGTWANGACLKWPKLRFESVLSRGEDAQLLNPTYLNIKTNNLPCCPQHIRYIRGKCHGDWAVDRWLGFQAVRRPTVAQDARGNAAKGQLGRLHESVECRSTVLRQQRRRCRCPVDRKHIRCLANSSELATVVTTYRLDERSSSCILETTSSKQRIDFTICPSNVHLDWAIYSFKMIDVFAVVQVFQSNQLEYNHLGSAGAGRLDEELPK
ncbi:unnamed protein product [Protopolystoma xenopodis]|uniref:Uncharacterized protein n=1 Tax=Protopolystoma xenopodis TaxID=117903 RepID=A0A448XBQ8_9PLAT|nr:unnamed protein product [Protopolystoma xenopodis]